MIQIRTVRQTIQLKGKSAPRLVVKTTPRQTLKLASAAPRGFQGERGPTGPSGEAQIPPILDGGNF